jgi:enamine deaminase RidA (YjgF/YER057c/UK114 family)
VPPAGDHQDLVRSGALLFLSGTGPLDGHRKPVFKGHIGAELSEEEGVAAARLSALNALATLADVLGDLDRITRVVRLTGYVSATPEFERHPWVINGASEVFTAVYGSRGAHARSTLGVTGLPLGQACVIDTIYEIDDRE